MMRRLATALSCTEGQAYSLTIGAVLAALLLLSSATASRPPVLATAAPAPAPPAIATVPPGALPPPPPATTAPAPQALAPPAPDVAGLAPLPLPPATSAAPTAPLPPAVVEPQTGGPPPPEATAPAPSDSVPLTVAEGGYVSDTGPLQDPSVPADGLPVGTVAGRTFQSSFVRLAGTATELVLPLSTASGASSNEAGAVLLACPITVTDWIAERDAASAPPFDCSKGVLSTRSGTAFSFDLAGFPDRADRHGFALVPAPGLAPTFRVVVQG